MSHTHSNFNRWMLAHVRAMRFAWIELLRSPILNTITIIVISIAIALPLGFFIVLKNLGQVDSTWNSAPTISLYLKTSTTPTQVDATLQLLRANAQIAQAHYISPTQGLKAFQKNVSFSNVLSLFQSNPIPGVITVLPAPHYRSPSTIQTLFMSLKILPVVDTAQLDMNWVARLFDIIAIGKRLTDALTLIFGVAVILIIGYALRASLSGYSNEIKVMRLIGATNAYIRRPLSYCGVLYGLLGGFISWIWIVIFLGQLQSPILRLAQTYHSPFRLQPISLSQGAMVIIISALLGLISAWLISTQFLNQPEQMD